MIHAYQSSGRTVVAFQTWSPFAFFSRSMSAPTISTRNPVGTSTRTDPRSPNAHAVNVANAGPTRMSLSDRGSPAGSSNVSRTLAVSP